MRLFLSQCCCVCWGRRGEGSLVSNFIICGTSPKSPSRWPEVGSPQGLSPGAACKGAGREGWGCWDLMHTWLSVWLSAALKVSCLCLLICMMPYPYGGVLFTSSRGMATLERDETRSRGFQKPSSVPLARPSSLFHSLLTLPLLCHLDFSE